LDFTSCKGVLMSKISYDDFTKMDLRVAKIVSVEQIPGKTRIVKRIAFEASNLIQKVLNHKDNKFSRLSAVIPDARMNRTISKY